MGRKYKSFLKVHTTRARAMSASAAKEVEHQGHVGILKSGDGCGLGNQCRNSYCFTTKIEHPSALASFKREPNKQQNGLRVD